jgi:hypothetical protein
MEVGANISHSRRRVRDAVRPSGVMVVVVVVMFLEDMELLEVPLTSRIPIRRTGGTLTSNQGLSATFSWHSDLTTNC